ncbi:hypothetical protein AVEN_32876-1 [Araneus ventricosus]|uniref:Uncharacterized protein n=1 Tax=Araneus ventricosus TaxID=182803 RepID=A0A4Y2PSX8_ARAVE|nr:hypothetical protein AVEN_32876-1 [Araneus ventricosus]
MDDQFNKLRDSHEPVLESIKNKLLTYTLKEHVLSEMVKNPDDGRWNHYDGETLSGVEELKDVLCEHLTDFISNNFSVTVKKNCDFCSCAFSVSHNCMVSGTEDCFNIHFEEALYNVGWQILAKANINRPYLRQLADEFFEILDIKCIFEKVEEMYVNEHSTDIIFHPL